MDHEATLYERLMVAHNLNMRNVLMPTNTLFGEAAAELLRLTEYAGNADLLRAEIGILSSRLEDCQADYIRRNNDATDRALEVEELKAKVALLQEMAHELSRELASERVKNAGMKR